VTRARALGIALIALGGAMPFVIDAVETTYRLDIKREFGVALWWALAAIGAVMFAWSFRRR
jgi:hypothetical protein